MRIRTLTSADVDAAMDLAAALSAAPHWPRASYVAALTAGPQRAALAAEDPAGRLAGFILAAVVPPLAELESIAVAPAFQRRGVARQLLAAALQQARTHGCEQMLLEVRASNDPARLFYASLGFTESGRRRDYYRDPPEDAVLMALSL